ncbi:hypothetical protein [Jannaschia sp. W003]|uniref:hypothetical protein n=1 Tax=Jannaschia sp. W003 TaxID=2867012 RepID=UPI0021A3A926|nr:hypothetical protein [Jannaschia sp. W003]UWQ20615.1 hypothetical protein K3554_11555 [Jannaschia sp. W003]
MARKGGGKDDGDRAARLKAALKANMGRRKALTRARGTVPNTHGRAQGDTDPDGTEQEGDER